MTADPGETPSVIPLPAPSTAQSTAPSTAPPTAERARSFDTVVDAYAAGRPTYPREAAQWMTREPGRSRRRVLELGAGTGKLTEQLISLGHRVIATDPSEPMLGRLRTSVRAARPVAAGAEQIPLATSSVDLVVSGQAFHWFDHDRALPEIARVLEPGGSLALAWNFRDERIPWVRRLSAIIGDDRSDWDPQESIDDSGLFETVEHTTFRFWQPLNAQSLRELVCSRSYVAVMEEAERAEVLRRVDELYDEYGRGHDGMLMPYETYAYRAVALPWIDPDASAAQKAGSEEPDHARDTDETDHDSLLIDFR